MLLFSVLLLCTELGVHALPEFKTKYYAKLAFKNTTADMAVMKSHCYPNRVKRRIINGQTAAPGQFPMAGDNICTASLISPIHILTAGHCFAARDSSTSRMEFMPRKWIAQLQHCFDAACKDFRALPNNSVVNVAVPSSFFAARPGKFKSDVAVAELETPVPMSRDFVENGPRRPLALLCLPRPRELLPALHAPQFAMYGWGIVNAEGSAIATHLQYLDGLHLVPRSSVYESDVLVLAHSSNQSRASFGDSGAPVLFQAARHSRPMTAAVFIEANKVIYRSGAASYEQASIDLRLYAKWICSVTGVCYMLDKE